MAPAPVSVPTVAEDTPLLWNARDEDRRTVKRDDAPHAPQRRAPYLSASSRCVIQLCALTLIFDFTQYSVYAPLTAVFEDIICTRYYSSASPSGLLSQRDCKVFPVQSELALVKGYKDTFNQIPSTFATFSLAAGRRQFGNSMTWHLLTFTQASSSASRWHCWRIA